MSTDIPLTASRRWALAIGLPFALVAIAYSALAEVSLVGQDSYRVPATVVPGSGKVTLGVGNGDITVFPSRDGRSQYSGVVSYSLIKPKLQWKPSSSGAFLVGGPDCFWLGNCGANLTLSLPAGRAVDASSGSGNLRLRDLSGSVEASSGSGDVVASSLSGTLQVFDSSGNISATGLTSESVRAGDSSGNVELTFTKPPAKVKVNDSSGNITLRLPGDVSYYVVANASSGSSNIDVPQDRLSHRVIRLSDASGNINVLPSGR